MKNALLIHGWYTKAEYYDASLPTASNNHWFPWLTKQLVLHGINTVAIEMPNGYYPEYKVWKRELERYDITPATILVGHSCGGGFLVRWLSETDKRVGKVVLVAPWLGYDTDGEPFDRTFFNATVGRDIAKKTAGLHLLYSSDDIGSVLRSVKEICDAVDDIQIRQFDGKKHFTLRSLGGPEFPELAEELLR